MEVLLGEQVLGLVSIILVRLLGKYFIGWIFEPLKIRYLPQILVLSQIQALDVDSVPRPHVIPLNPIFFCFF